MQSAHKIYRSCIKFQAPARIHVKLHNAPRQFHGSSRTDLCTIVKKIPKTSVIFLRYQHNVQKNSNNNIPIQKTPELVYIPRLFRWLSNKMKLKYLQKMWDCEFSEGAFIYGSTRAICRITEIIRCNNIEDLNGLLCESAKNKLIMDLHTKLTPTQKLMIELKPCDIKILIPVFVQLSNCNGEKICRISLRVLALKWYKQLNGVCNLVLVALQTEFIRNYKCLDPDWTISNFDILDCTLLKETSRI